ncbi:MAG: hypothetical protein VKI63_02495, partial [Cyanobium sp.]|nr:hypothetical protein [Cyanobium sp.]
EDGRYRMEAPRQFIPKLDPDYKRALAQMETLVATMNPNAAQFPVAANALRELRANPQYSVHGENSRTPGQIVQTRALGLTQAGLNVINPTAPSLLSDSVRRVSRPSTFTTGSYEIAGVPLPDVGQEAHGFEAYHDPGADRGDEYEQMSVAQRWRQDMLDGMTPIKSYVIPSTDLAQVPVWPGSTDRGVLAPKEGAPMVARTEEGDLHLVVPRPTGQTLPDTTPLFEHRLGPKLDPMQTPPEVAPDGTITQAFRVSQNKPNELVGMITVKGWEDFGRNFADEARAAGIAPRSSEVANPYNLGLLANQKLAADRPVNKLQAALLDRAVDRNPNAGRRYAGSFPAARTVASPAVRPDPGAGQLYPIVKAVTQQSALPINHRLSAFEPEDSPVVREYLDMAEPMARKILEQRANWRQSVGLRGDGVTAEATWPKNSLLGHSARSAARLQGSAPVAGFTPAMLASLPERVQGQVRSMLRPDGSTNAHGLHWLATFGQRYGLTRPQASASTESPREPGDPNAWHQDFQRIPAARAPMGDSPLHVSGDEAPLATPGQVLGTAPRQVPQRRVAGAALSGPVDEMVPQVSYVPSERGLYVIGPEGTRLHAPAMDAADEKFAAFVRQRLAGRRL